MLYKDSMLLGNTAYCFPIFTALIVLAIQTFAVLSRFWAVCGGIFPILGIKATGFLSITALIASCLAAS